MSNKENDMTNEELETKVAAYRAQGLPRLSALRLIREQEASRKAADEGAALSAAARLVCESEKASHKVADVEEVSHRGPLSDADVVLVAAYRKSGMTRGDALRRVRQAGEKL
jgi:hypothetical protein